MKRLRYVLHDCHAVTKKFSSIKKYLITLIVIIGMLLLWIVGLYVPFTYKKQLFDKEIEQLNDRYKASIESYKKYMQLHKQYDALTEQYQFVTQKYSPKTTDTQIDHVLQLLGKHNLTLLSFTLDKQYEKMGYIKQDALYSFTGSMQSIINFLKAATGRDSLLSCNAIHLEKLSDTQYKVECTLQNIVHKLFI